MLERLVIHSFAIIDDLTLEFGPGLNAVTGETGAGQIHSRRCTWFGAR